MTAGTGDATAGLERTWAVGRRDLVAAFLGLGACALVPSAVRHVLLRPTARVLADWLRSLGAGLFCDRSVVCRLGAIYLAAHPAECSRELLSQRLIGGDHGSIPSRLVRTVADDWSRSDVVVVDGWLLARAEARLCAFLHLEKSLRA